MKYVMCIAVRFVVLRVVCGANWLNLHLSNCKTPPSWICTG